MSSDVVFGYYNGHVELRRFPSLRTIHTWSAHPDVGVTAVELSDDHKMLATGTSDGCVVLWDASGVV